MTNDKNAEPNGTHPAVTQEALAHMGDGRLAYVRQIRSEKFAEIFPQAPQIEPGVDLLATCRRITSPTSWRRGWKGRRWK